MKVLVKVHGLQFAVPCGEGRQSCKWLALAAAQRYALAAPHGRCRTREDAHVRQGFFLPCGVAKANGQMLPPDKAVADVCKDNEVLTVSLQQEVPVNELGAPVLHPWAVRAFFPSSQRVSARDMAADAKDATGSPRSDAKASAKALAAAADSKAASVEGDDAVRAYAASEQQQQAASGQFLSEMEAEAAFLFDWGRARADELASDARHRDALRDALLAHFAAISSAYRHYATGSGETGFGLSRHELAHFLHECGLLDLHDSNAVAALDKPLRQALRHDALASPWDRETLSRAGFLHVLARLLLANGGTDAVAGQLADAVTPAVTRLTAGPVRDVTHDDRVTAAVLAAKPKLLKLVARYAGDVDGHSSLLPAPALRAMLAESGVFCSGSAATQDETFAAAIASSVAGGGAATDTATRLVFAEAVEVTARVALAMLGGDPTTRDLPPVDAVRLALEAVRSLPLRPTATRK